jgi:Undecaprenyl-phosphate glucose phosphotransferase
LLKQQQQLFVALLAVADGAVITAASFAAWMLRRGLLNYPDWWPKSLESYPKQALALYTVPITLLSLRFFGLYKARRDRTLLSEVYELCKAAALAMLGVLAVLYVFESAIFNEAGPHLAITTLGVDLDPGRVQLGLLALILPAALVVHRTAFRLVLRLLRRRGWNLRHVAIIGSGRLGQIVARTLERNGWTGIRVAYFIAHTDAPPARRTQVDSRPVLGGLRDLERLLGERKPDAVYVALPARQAAHLPDVLARLEKFPVDVRVVPDVSPRFVPQSMSVSELDGMPILSYRESPTTGLGGLSKRALDIAGGVVALLVFLPVMLVVAALVRISGPGPVIFKQRRVSLGGQTFDIYKFRTMYHVSDERHPGPRPARAAEAGPGAGAAHPEWTRPNDSRVTPVGRFLRRTSLDELPQLLNVIVGDMSLVGPRPERPELIERFKEDWRGYMLRQHVKAGMTGWAQINGHRGNSSLRKRLQYDLFYVKNWSLSFDLKILWLTLFRGFVHKNAH